MSSALGVILFVPMRPYFKTLRLFLPYSFKLIAILALLVLAEQSSAQVVVFSPKKDTIEVQGEVGNSTYCAVRIQNQTLLTASIGFAINSSEFSSPSHLFLKEQASDSIRFTFTPHSAGEKVATLTIFDTVGVDSVVVSNVALIGTAKGLLQLTHAIEVDFVDVPLKTTDCQQLAIHNPNNLTVIIDSMVIDSKAFSIPNKIVRILAGRDTSLTICYSDTVVRTTQGRLAIYYSLNGTAIRDDIALSGSIHLPDTTASPDTCVTFSTPVPYAVVLRGGYTGFASVLQNISKYNVRIDDFRPFDGDTSSFLILLAKGVQLSAGQSSSVIGRFTPPTTTDHKNQRARYLLLSSHDTMTCAPLLITFTGEALIGSNDTVSHELVFSEEQNILTIEAGLGEEHHTFHFHNNTPNDLLVTDVKMATSTFIQSSAVTSPITIASNATLDIPLVLIAAPAGFYVDTLHFTSGTTTYTYVVEVVRRLFSRVSSATVLAPPLAAWPNPASQSIHLSASGATIREIAIDDMLGRECWSSALNAREVTIERNTILALPTGSYLVRAQIERENGALEVREVPIQIQR